MQHGDIVVRVSVGAEPQKLFTYWRGSFGDLVPDVASITIVRPWVRSSDKWTRYYDPSISLEAMSRSEDKRAVLSISDKALNMQAGEIAIARHLTEVVYGWLSRRTGIPRENQPIPNARVWVKFGGGPEVIDALEKLDPEILGSVEIGAVYLQGEPRRPEARWLVPIESREAGLTLEGLSFEKSLVPGQADEVRKLVGRVRAMFQKRATARRTLISKLFREAHGCDPEEPYTDEEVDNSYGYKIMLAAVKDAGKPKKPRERIRSWHA
jgi:hypothetical protein